MLRGIVNMESALQVDLAKHEAPAEQVLDAAHERALPCISLPLHAASLETASRSPSKHSHKGGSATTTQIQLNSVILENHQSTLTTQTPSLKEGIFDETANSFTLQPADEGFGAWSYVASAFAMYIVVWGISDTITSTHAIVISDH